ncbi:hypothetical protein OQA88_11950 [Cercophora sp. LCS_1]
MTTIKEKIYKAEDWKIRAILTALCDDTDTCRKAEDLLKQLNRSNSSDTVICVQCGIAFNKNRNTKKLCRYHNGAMEPDYDGDFWADHDEDAHGEINTKDNKKEYPEGFIFDCCERMGDKPGCRRFRHESDPAKNRRNGAKYDDSASETAPDDDDGGRYVEGSDEESANGNGKEEDSHDTKKRKIHDVYM